MPNQIQNHNPKKSIVFALIITAFVLGGLYLLNHQLTAPPISPGTLTPPPPPRPVAPPLPPSLSDQLAAQTNIKKFKNYDELKSFLEENPPQGGYPGGFGRAIADGMVALEAAPSLGAPLSSKMSETSGIPATPQDYSQTNIQVAGVDEADIIKTDGSYIYIVSKNNLFIIKAFPGEEAEILAKIVFNSTPQGMYISENRLVIYGHNGRHAFDSNKPLKRRGEYTFIKIFDITNKKNPQLIRDLNFEGTYNNSRMIENYVYLITTTSYLYTYGVIDPESPMPSILENGEPMCSPIISMNNCPDIYYFDIPYTNYNYTTVSAINIENSTAPITSEVYLFDNNQNMYVSQNNLYITYTKYISEYQLQMEADRAIVFPRLSAKDRERIQEIEAVQNFILTRDEKMNKIGAIVERYIDTLSGQEQQTLEEEIQVFLKNTYRDIGQELEKTVIHKIALDKEKLEYQKTGEVPGSALNQFSMDEHNGFFRIATTKNSTFSQFLEDTAQEESYSNLYILDGDLRITGRVERLAEGERIFSVRFMQDRAYLVTFKQTDPLFVIDVADPRNPAVLGELKIPGVSEYLHPYDSTTLIGFGHDADENGRLKGLKLSLFDVADVAQPREIDSYIWGDRGSSSLALYEHHAFLFSADKNLLVVPVETDANFIIQEEALSSSPSKPSIFPPQPRFRGAYVFTVTKDGFTLKGTVGHGTAEDANPLWKDGYNYYDTTVQRSLYIDDALYTLSNQYLKINALDDLAQIKTLPLFKEKQDDFEVVN